VILSFLISLGAFLLLLSVVVIAHEYGHYKTGRLLGIGVERFAFGFGPALRKWVRDGVEFRINAIPLGGYVKFVGDEPNKPVPDELRDKAFNLAPIYKRALTVFAGPAMNVVLAFLLFCVIFAVGFPAAAAVLGDVLPDTPAARAGLRAGDRVVAIDGEPIKFWHELSLRIADSPDVPMTLTVERAGQRYPIGITPERITAPDMIFMFQTKRGSIGVAPNGTMPLIGVRDPQSAAYQAGLRTADLVLTANGRPITFYSELESVLAALGPVDIELGVARGDEELEREKPRPNVQVRVPAPTDGGWTLNRLGIESGDLFVYGVTAGSPAATAGLQRDDRLLAVNGEPVDTWEAFTTAIRAKPEQEVAITVWRDNQEVTVRAVPEKVEKLDLMGQKEVYGRVGVQRLVAFTPVVADTERYWNPAKIFVRGLQESWTWTVRIGKGIYYLFVGKVPTSSLGGPIAIARMAGESARMGFIEFLLFTAIISFNLAFINLMPVPIFDGGHLLLFTIEKAIGRPLSERAMTVALRIGMAVLAALFVLIFYNDFRWVFFKLKEMHGT
jgi:regulator of sigma E protease